MSNKNEDVLRQIESKALSEKYKKGRTHHSSLVVHVKLSVTPYVQDETKLEYPEFFDVIFCLADMYFISTSTKIC